MDGNGTAFDPAAQGRYGCLRRFRAEVLELRGDRRRSGPRCSDAGEILGLKGSEALIFIDFQRVVAYASVRKERRGGATGAYHEQQGGAPLHQRLNL